MAIKVFPVKAVRAVNYWPALGRLIVLLQDVTENQLDAVISDAATPPKIAYRVESTCHASVADALHGVPSNTASRRERVAGAHVNWIRCMAKLKAASQGSLLM